jgi:hypothetical protein
MLLPQTNIKVKLPLIPIGVQQTNIEVNNMKKLTSFVLCACFMVLLSACFDDPIVPTTTTTISVTTTEEPTDVTLPTFDPKKIELFPPDKWDGFRPTYRYIYYRLDGFVQSLALSEDEANKWFKDYDSRQDFYSNTQNEMLIVTFVKHFNIQKDIFEEALKKYVKISLENNWEINTNEENELPNPDIIYTFDNDIINEYYRRE